MKVRTVLTVAGATAIAAAAAGGALAAGERAAAAGTSGPSVSVDIEGASKTLLLPTTVHTGSGSITKFGAPAGKCSARSAQGALDRATHGHWKGTWSKTYNEYFITSIMGEKPTGHDYWEIFDNYAAATKGACDIKLHPGDHLLFVDESGKLLPSVLGAPRHAGKGNSFNVQLIGYRANGQHKPLAGVTITGNGIHSVKTDGQGYAKITNPSDRTLVLRASPRGYVRSEAKVPVSG